MLWNCLISIRHFSQLLADRTQNFVTSARGSFGIADISSNLSFYRNRPVYMPFLLTCTAFSHWSHLRTLWNFQFIIGVNPEDSVSVFQSNRICLLHLIVTIRRLPKEGLSFWKHNFSLQKHSKLIRGLTNIPVQSHVVNHMLLKGRLACLHKASSPRIGNFLQFYLVKSNHAVIHRNLDYRRQLNLTQVII